MVCEGGVCSWESSFCIPLCCPPSETEFCSVKITFMDSIKSHLDIKLTRGWLNFVGYSSKFWRRPKRNLRWKWPNFIGCCGQQRSMQINVSEYLSIFHLSDLALYIRSHYSNFIAVPDEKWWPPLPKGHRQCLVLFHLQWKSQAIKILLISLAAWRAPASMCAYDGVTLLTRPSNQGQGVVIYLDQRNVH